MSPADATPSDAPSPTDTTTASATPTATTTETTSPSPADSSSATPAPSSTPEATVTVTVTATPEPTTATSVAPVVTVTSGWTTPPASVRSELPWGLVLSAVVVLVAGLVAVVWLVRRHGGPAGPTPVGPTPVGPVSTGPMPTGPMPTGPGAAETGPPGAGLLAFLVLLGETMLDASAPSGQVNETLLRVAAVNGAPDAEVVSLPTALLVSLPSGDGVRTAAVAAGSRTLRLDQVQAVHEVADAARVGRVSPAVGTARLADALAAAEPYPFGLRLLGYVLVSAGLALILGGGWPDLVVAALLGAGVAVVLRATARVGEGYSALVVLGCAFGVSTVAFLLARTGWQLVPLAALVPPLVTFLPGALLTTAAIDLATRQMVAGAARLASGGMQLVLLALGITAGAGLVGVPAALTSTSPSPLGTLAPWLGVLVYGTGVVWHNGAARGARRWIMLVLLVAYAGQVLGGLLFGSTVSALVGAFAMTPVAAIAATRPTGPPAMVTFLPGFWLLVPGALGLVGVTSVIGYGSGVSAVVTAATTMVTISLGVLTGLAVSGPVTARLSRDGGGP